MWFYSNVYQQEFALYWDEFKKRMKDSYRIRDEDLESLKYHLVEPGVDYFSF